MSKNTYDNLLLLKDAGAVTATGAAQVGGSARVIDVGLASVGNAKAVIDTSAIDTVTGDETYRVAIQGAEAIGFATPVELAAVLVTAAGRVDLPFSNVKGGTTYRYIRAHNTVGGTTPSINATIFVAKD